MFDLVNWSSEYDVFFDVDGNAKALTSRWAYKAQSSDWAPWMGEELDYSDLIYLGPYPKYGFDWEASNAGFSAFEQRLLLLEEDIAP